MVRVNSPPSCMGCSHPRSQQSSQCPPKALLPPLFEKRIDSGTKHAQRLTKLLISGAFRSDRICSRWRSWLRVRTNPVPTLTCTHHRSRCGVSMGRPGHKGSRICSSAPGRHCVRATQKNTHDLAFGLLEQMWTYFIATQSLDSVLAFEWLRWVDRGVNLFSTCDAHGTVKAAMYMSTHQEQGVVVLDSFHATYLILGSGGGDDISADTGSSLRLNLYDRPKLRLVDALDIHMIVDARGSKCVSQHRLNAISQADSTFRPSLRATNPRRSAGFVPLDFTEIPELCLRCTHFRSRRRGFSLSSV